MHMVKIADGMNECDYFETETLKHFIHIKPLTIDQWAGGLPWSQRSYIITTYNNSSNIRPEEATRLSGLPI